MPLGAAPSSPAREPRPDSQVDLVRPVVQRPDRRNPARQAKPAEKPAAPRAVPSRGVAAQRVAVVRALGGGGEERAPAGGQLEREHRHHPG